MTEEYALATSFLESNSLYLAFSDSELELRLFSTNPKDVDNSSSPVCLASLSKSGSFKVSSKYEKRLASHFYESEGVGSQPRLIPTKLFDSFMYLANDIVSGRFKPSSSSEQKYFHCLKYFTFIAI